MPFGAWTNYVFDKNVLGELVEITFHPDSMSFTVYYDGQTWRMDKWESSEWRNPVHKYIEKKHAIAEYNNAEWTNLGIAINEFVGDAKDHDWKVFYTLGRKITFRYWDTNFGDGNPTICLEFDDDYFPVFTEEEIQQIRDILGDRLAKDWNGTGFATVSFSLKGVDRG